jgi:quinol monooxygenase YgiN
MIVEVTVKAGMESRFLELIKDDAEHSEADEPGCLRFDVLQDVDDPRKYYFYEVYRDDAAFRAHREMPHFTRIDSEIPQLFESAAVHTTKNVIPVDSGFAR